MLYCSQCGCSYDSLYELDVHMRDKHIQEKEKGSMEGKVERGKPIAIIKRQNKVICLRCNRLMNDQAELEYHITQLHRPP